MTQRDYDSTVARIAGNIAPQILRFAEGIDPEWVAKHSVKVARAIIAEVKRTETEELKP